jgi:uncharacterized membrane protein YbhN (UPF0104 family)/tRNA A-37 threonylcarbamoyl transferase component Bud32
MKGSPAAPSPAVGRAWVDSPPLAARSRLRPSRAAFGPASEEPYRRRPSDGVRLVVGALAVGLLATRAGRLSATETSLFRLFNTLPNGLHTLAAALYRLGALWAVGLVAVAALGARRWRLARDLSLSGLLGWVTARAVGLFVSEGAHHVGTILRAGTTPTFPFVRLAVTTAVLRAASPYLTRPSRRVGHGLLLVLALSALYLGTAYPNDLLAGLVLGWAVAAAVHVAFGSPGGRPTSPQVAGALGEVGLQVTGVHLARTQSSGATVMRATGSEGDLRVKLIGRDEADTRLVSKLWRFLYYKDSGPTFFLTRRQQLQHEAFTVLLARAGGVRTPAVLLAGSAGPGIALEVEQWVPGTLLADVESHQVTDGDLADLWAQVVRLHAAGVTHGSLDGHHVLLAAGGQDDGRSVLIDFSSALSPTTSDHRAADTAELLVATSVVVGEERAMASAVAGLGAEALVAALPFLQPAALTHRGRVAAGHGRKDRGARLDRLRQLGAEATDTAPPALQQLQRVRTSSLVLAVGALLGIGGLLGAVGNPSKLVDDLRNANAGWIVLALGVSLLTNLGYALALMGAVKRKLPIGPNVEMQLASSFSNLAIPLGGTGLQVRFLQKQGIPLASAVAAGGLLSTVASVVVQVALLVVALSLSPHHVHVSGLHGIVTALVYVGAILVALAGLLVGVPLLRRRFLPPVEHAAASLWEVVRSPSRMSLLVTGNLIVAVLNAMCLLLCLEAYANPISLWTILAVNISISTLSSLIPIPGGGTAVASVGLAGALVAYGVPQATAVAAVLTNQVVASYLPAIPGWFATTHLIHHDLL